MAEIPKHRLPTRSVWLTEKTVRRENPRTGRPQKKRLSVVRWKETDRVRERSFESPLEAGRFAVDLEQRLENGVHGGLRADIPFSEWTDRFLRSRFADFEGTVAEPPQDVGDGYLRQLLLSARNLVEVIGDRPLTDYRSIDFETFRTKMNASGKWSPVTTESRLARIRTIFRAAWKDDLLHRPPEIKVRDLFYEKQVLEMEEIKAIFEAAKRWPAERPGQMRRFGMITGRLYPVLATLYFTMMRRGELIHLTWSDVRETADGEREILIQPKEWSEPGADGTPVRKAWEPKDREIRSIPVHPVLEAILLDLEARRNGTPWVFTNTRGGRWTAGGLASLVRRFEEATGLKVGFHTWRRTGLTHLHDASVPPGQIQEIAGHSSFATTMRYIRPSAKGKRMAIRSLPRFE